MIPKPIGRLFVEGTLTGLSDAELLRRFSCTRDALAFEALIDRHGPMVLGVCRGLLNDPNDAEDAFQSTFLILVRKARTLRGSANLAGWLYLAARRVAIRANVSASRRRKHERWAGLMKKTVSELKFKSSNRDDLLRALHEEIARLPSENRLAVILCDIQGVSQDLASIELRLSKRTLRRRLNQGRERLRARLARQGLGSNPAMLGALCSTNTNFVVPTTWKVLAVQAAIATLESTSAVGLVSTTTLALTREVSQAMSIQKLIFASAVVAASGLLGWATSAALLSPSSSLLPSVMIDKPSPKTSQVAGPPPQPSRPRSADRNGPITGRILDLEGRPVQGVKVRVDEINKAKEGDLTPWIEAIQRGEPSWVAYKLLEQEKGKLTDKAETDAQGRFRIEGLGTEKVITLSIEGPTVAHTHLQVVTRQVEPFSAQGFTNGYGPGSQTIYGADLTLSAAPGRVVEGVVRDVLTKQVMKNVGVRSFSFAGSHILGIKTLKTSTDEQGRFRLAGFPKGEGNKLLIVPNDDQPYFMQDVILPDPPGIGAIPVEIGLHKGLWIEGRVTDQETGAPVVGAWLHNFPFLENSFVESTPEFQGGLYRGGTAFQDRYQSQADGTFRLVGLPGRSIVGAVVYHGKSYRRGAGAELIQGMDEQGHFATVHNPVTASRLFPTSMKEINAAEGTETVYVDIALDPGAKVHLQVVDPQGKPVTGVKTGGRLSRDRYDVEAQVQAEFDVETLGPEEVRLVLIVHEGRKLGRVVPVKAGDDKDGPVVVMLEQTATVTGRIVDRDGDPVTGASINCSPKETTTDYSIQLPELGSGPDGSFTLANVPTGCGYSLVAEGTSLVIESSELGFAERDLTVRPGETTDLGEIPLLRRP